MKNSILFAAVIFVMAGCGSHVVKQVSEVAPQEKFFSGEYIYLADAATFKDCATGVVIPVVTEAASLSVEQQYTRMGASGEALFMECIGHIEFRTPMEESKGDVPMLVIDSLIGFDQTTGCNPNFVVVGVYEKRDTVSNAENLHLRSDYTFTRRIFDPESDKEQVINGSWYRVSDKELYLLDTAQKDNTLWVKLTIDGITPEMLITKDSVKYKKVYL